MESNHIYIGLDLSINSTGICINRGDSQDYWIIVSKLTKKMKEFNCNNIHYLCYDKKDMKGYEYLRSEHTIYSAKEEVKSINLFRICNCIKSILEPLKTLKNTIIYAYIEGVAYQAIGSVADLAGLNYLVRGLLHSLNIPFYIISPTDNKKKAVGDGGASKDVMIASWKMIYPEYKNLNIKIDDIVDAYFLSTYHF